MIHLNFLFQQLHRKFNKHLNYTQNEDVYENSIKEKIKIKNIKINKMKNKIKILIVFMAMFLVNYSSWGQRWNGGERDLSSTPHGTVYPYISGTSPLGKFANPATVILPNGTHLSLAAGETFPIGLPGEYVVGGATYAFGFFIIFFYVVYTQCVVDNCLCYRRIRYY